MYKKFILLLGFFWLATVLVSAQGIEELEPACRADGSFCDLVQERSLAGCREIDFNTNKGEINLLACEKGDMIELYRQSFPSDLVFEACLGDACVDQWKGFEAVNIGVSEDPDVPIDPVNNENSDFALSVNDVSNEGMTYGEVVEEWNEATWNADVDESFDSDLAAVRWYTTEGQCEGEKCEQQLHTGHGRCPDVDVSDSKFCGVTDEFSNVLLNHALGTNLERYEKLHNFAESLRHPDSNNLQCWMYYVNGDKDYEDYSDLCVASDSASDASIRILGAYALACAKQEAGIWNSGIDFCADYNEQGNAIFGIGTASHGEVKKLGNGRYFLANGYNNQVNAPTTSQSIRPDYYELQFMMDFAKYSGSVELEKAVYDILGSYKASLGNNWIHKGKTGHFNADGFSGYQCDDLCNEPYMDNIDTWRAIPALSGLNAFYSDEIPSELKVIYNEWWNRYGSAYDPNGAKPFEIFADSANGVVKSSEDSYKTLGMWIPLSAGFDDQYTEMAVNHMIELYDFNADRFRGSAYHGAYFSQFPQRAIGVATGIMSPNYWRGDFAGNMTVNLTIENETSIIVNFSQSNIECGIGDLNLESDCENSKVLRDETSGTCRTVEYSTNGGNAKIMICEKEANYEIYRQSYPSGSECEICVEGSCVDNQKGFNTLDFGFCSATQQEPVQPEEPEIGTGLNLNVRCSAENSNCDLISDKIEGTCRDFDFSTNKGEINLLACEKGDMIELYRQSFPSDLVFEACLGDACVDQWKGFDVLN